MLAPINNRLGVPFSYTSFVSSHAAKLVLLIPLLAVILPLFRAMPAFYVWIMRRRLVYWYRQLKALERGSTAAAPSYDPAPMQAEMERIDAGGAAHAGAALLFQRALRSARPHRPRAPAAAGADRAGAGAEARWRPSSRDG